MKFRDIPQFTSWGSYQANLPLRWLNQRLQEWEEEGLQLNPDFQRGHVWTEEQQIKFIEFLLKGGTSARTIFFNHPGWMGSFQGEFVCVDGLQRLTACRKFLNNEIPAFGTYYKDFEDTIPNDIDLIVNVNNLKTKKEVLQWYLEMNSGGTVHTEQELNKVKDMLKCNKKEVLLGMDQQYLLTYQCKDKGYGTFACFHTEEELQEFVDENKVHVIDAIKIIQCEEVEY